MTRRGKKRLLILVGITALLGGAATGAYFVREARRAQQIAQAYAEGMAAYDAGDYENALRGLGKALSEHREDPEVLYRVADARWHVPVENNRHLGAAIPYAREAANRAPQDARPLALLLVLYRRVGFVTERLDAAERLLALDGAHQQAHIARIECLATLGRSSEVQAAVDALLAVHSQDLYGHQSRIETMRLNGHPAEEVLAYTKDLVTQYPENLMLATLQVRVLAAYGNREEAIEAAKRAQGLKIPDAEALLELVRMLDQIGLRTDADVLLDRNAMDTQFRDDVHAYLIERAWKAGQMDRARQHAAMHAEPLDATPSRLLGWIALTALPVDGGWQSGAVGAELTTRTDDQGRYWQGLLDSREFMDAAEYSKARQRLSELVALPVTDSLAWLMLGEADQRLGESEMAVLSLEEAVRQDPTSSRAQMMLATSLLDLGRLDEARLPAERAVMSNPGAAEALTLARIYVALIDANRADQRIRDGVVTILEEMSAQAPDQADVQALLARTYVAVGHLEEAQVVIGQMATMERLPNSAVLLDLANACRRSAPQLVEGVLAVAARLETVGPGLMALQMSAGSAALAPEVVRARYEDAIKTADDANLRMQYEIAYARYLDATGDEGALAELKRISTAYPDRPEAQNALLDSRAGWTDEKCIVDAIERLKAVTGENAARWKLADAQRRLAFEPGDEAASAVVLSLTPLTQPPSSNVRAMMLCSDAMLMLGDKRQAIDILLRALDRDSSNPLLYAHTIDLLQSAGRATEAATRLREFLAIRTLSPEFQRRRVELLARAAMWDEAIRDCESLLAATGESQDRLMLAVLHGGHGQSADARRLFDGLLAEPDASRDVRIAAADFYAAAESVERGAEMLKPLQEQLTASEYIALLAGYYERQGRLDETARLLETQAQSSGDGDDWAALAEFQIRTRQADQARSTIAAGLRADADHPALLALHSLIDSLESGSLGPESIDDIIDALVDESLRPAMKQIAAAMQYAEANPGDSAGYIKRLRDAVDSEPALILGWQLLAGALLNAGQADEAVLAAQNAARVLPNSVRAAELLATTLADAGRFTEARAGAGRWRQLDSERPTRADLLIAQIETQSGQPERALTAIQPWVERIKAEADQFPTRLGLYASILIQAGRADEAHELIWPRAEKSGDWAQAYVRLAAEIGDVSLGVQWVDRAEPLVPLTPDTRMGMAQVRSEFGQRGGGADQFRKAVALLEPLQSDPAFPAAALAMLAGCQQQLGEIAAAEATYRKALAAAPGDPIILNNLAYLLLDSAENADEALQMATQAVAAAKQRNLPAGIRANLADTLGTAQLSAGLFDEAQRSFRDGLVLDGRNALLQLGLAEALARAGRVDDARVQYEQVAARRDVNRSDADLAARLDRVAALVN
ncbi:MAG: tetratricopeptide repeat protein [Phycisphaerales bacterium]|nr:tetratricopeptide repeat protein [Phycisphaerales bacterium]